MLGLACGARVLATARSYAARDRLRAAGPSRSSWRRCAALPT